MEANVSTGIGYNLSKRQDLVGLGVSWGRPSADGLDDQATVEFFYRLQLAQDLAITPDVQLLINPALNPDENVLAVFGLHARLSF